MFKIPKLTQTFKFKIIIVGDLGTGKSNILSRFSHNKFCLLNQSNVGIEFRTKEYQIDNSKVKFVIGDTA